MTEPEDYKKNRQQWQESQKQLWYWVSKSISVIWEILLKWQSFHSFGTFTVQISWAEIYTCPTWFRPSGLKIAYGILPF